MVDPRPSLRVTAELQQILDTTLAKSERDEQGRVTTTQSYWEHIVDCYDVWRQLVEAHRPLIERVADRQGIPPTCLHQSSLLCVTLHDLGKLTKNAQDMFTARNKAEYRAAVRRNYRHEVAGVWLVRELARRLRNEDVALPGEGVLEALAVAGHHRYLAEGFLFDEAVFLQELHWRPDLLRAVSAGYNLARVVFKDQGWRLPNPKLPADQLERHLTTPPDASGGPHAVLIRARNDVSVLSNLLGADGAEKLREIFAVLKGLLMIADWRASGALERPELRDVARSVVRVRPAELREHLGQRLRPKFSDYLQFQLACAEAPHHVLAIAPTGSGKTEAGFLWALHQIQHGDVRKLLFLLPTMVTANSLYERATAFFKPRGHDVALVHSTADLVAEKTRGRKESGADGPTTRAEVLADRHLFAPVTVGTIDQLLTTLFHAGRWAMKTMAAGDAAIVIDEVHAYDPHTAGLVMLLLRQLDHLGARFMVMSATMPTDLQDTVLEALSTGGPARVELVRDQELLDCSRNTWSACKKTPVTDWLTVRDSAGRRVPSPDARRLLEQTGEDGRPLRILIVVNTVQQCQDLARAFRRLVPDLVCYHSKFVLRHRKSLEHRINSERRRPRLLIATQVVEVALDIDYDILHTEAAPFDALIQRAGRVNRRRRSLPGHVVVHPPEESAHTLYGEPPGVLEASWQLCQDNPGALTEQKLLELVEQAYAGHRLCEHRDFLDVQAATIDVQRRCSGVLDNPSPEDDPESPLGTRLVKYQQVSVIPDCFETAVRKRPAGDRRWFELKMPLWYAKKCGRQDHESDVIFCRMEYDCHLGAQFLTDSDDGNPACLVI